MGDAAVLVMGQSRCSAAEYRAAAVRLLLGLLLLMAENSRGILPNSPFVGPLCNL